MTKTTNPNVAALGLTKSQAKVYSFINEQQKAGLTITGSEVHQAVLSDKSYTWSWKVLTALAKKGLIERYANRYYKLKGNP